MIKINVRYKNPYFWIGLLGVIFTAIDADIEMFTNWQIVIDSIKNVFSNPYMILNIIMAIIGLINDPTK